MIWNIIVTATLLTMGSSYVPRFYVTFVMVCLIGLTMIIKVVIGILYMVYYKCKSPSLTKTPVISSKSRIADRIEHYKPEIMESVRRHL